MAEPEPSKEEENRKAGFAYAAGIALFATVAAFTGIGWMLDKWFGTQPWCLVGGIVAGSAAGLFEFVRLSSKTY
ncbi:MAG TPA: AtpZ/AtpI family protein [Pyrinomonadaceae bacterium]|nr:AtpZ/AtpI family protein [Pyrinomonadaceae bacterium]